GVWKLYYYVRNNAHLKSLSIAYYGKYLDRYCYAGMFTLVNHITGKSTTLTWTEFQFQNNLNENDFTRTGLRRIR
ncbi:MAG: outer membrane lipoprotein-sorting protein, partial [Acidobacteriota bacterium]|nr:outer membrane lipoprotein-sorting protein [Acidobacteriota bacterium]